MTMWPTSKETNREMWKLEKSIDDQYDVIIQI